MNGRDVISYDAATTVVPRGKLEVFVKRGNGLPLGWAVDENGHDSDDADRVLKNIIDKTGTTEYLPKYLAE